MRTRIRFTAGIAAIALAAGLATLPFADVDAAPIPADKKLPLTSFRGWVVDEPHGKIFLSGSVTAGRGGGEVTVADLSGKALRRIAGVKNTGAVVMTPDGSNVVVVSGAGLVVVDAATEGVTRRISTGAEVCPTTIAPASGKIFFTYSDCSGYNFEGLGAADLETGVVSVGLIATGRPSQARIVSTPGAPDTLVATFDKDLAVLDTTGGPTPTATVRASRRVSPGGAALTYDGSQVIVGAGRAFKVRSTTDLLPGDSYPVSWDAGSVVVRRDGLVAVSSTDGEEKEIRIYRPVRLLL